MIEFLILQFFLIFLATVQSILGVGILVLGTPILLIFEFKILEIIQILLPISILTSLINIIIIKKKKNPKKIKLNKKQKESFFYICIPSVFIGLLILKKFESLINFNVVISIIIFLTILLKLYQNKIWIYLKQSFLLKSIMFMMGIVHGITNTGGTLLVLFFTQSFKGMLNQNRYNISFFYLFLAIFQYLIFIYLFENIVKFNIQYILLISSVIPGVILGNITLNYFNEKLIDKIITYLSILSALTLLIKT